MFGIPIIVQQSEADKNILDDLLFPVRKTEPMSSKLFIQNLPSVVTEGDLEELFNPFGRIESVELQVDGHTRKSKGFAFVKYRHTNGNRYI